MVVINLDRKDGEYGKGKYEISVTTEPYVESNLFFKVTHSEIKKNNWNFTHLRFASSNSDLKAGKYHFTDTTPFSKVEVYFSKHNSDKPLVLGIITNGSRYYSFTQLKRIGNWTNLATRGRWFGSGQLTDKLIEEDYVHNRVIGYKLGWKYRYKSYNNINIDIRNFPKYNLYTHKPGHEDRIKKSNIFYRGKSLILETVNEISEAKRIAEIHNKVYSNITVCYRRETGGKELTEPPFFLELKGNGDSISPKSYSLQRVDKEGVRWAPIDDYR